MKLNDLQDALRTRPFKPFRMLISGGESFEIHHPELCVAGYTSAFIGFPAPEDADAKVYARYTVIDLDHIIRVEPLPAAAGAKGA